MPGSTSASHWHWNSRGVPQQNSKVGTLPNIGKYFHPFHPGCLPNPSVSPLRPSLGGLGVASHLPKWVSSRVWPACPAHDSKDKGISKGSQMARLVLRVFTGLMVLCGSAIGAPSTAGSHPTASISNSRIGNRMKLGDEAMMALVGSALIGVGLATRRVG